MFQLPKHLLVFDVETSGTDTQISSIIQLGAVILNKNGDLETEEFSEYIIPYTREWQESAYQVHKLSKNFLNANGRPLQEVIAKFEKWASRFGSRDLKKNYNLSQWSCGFDTSCLQMAYHHLAWEYPFHYRAYDIASIVRFYLARQGKLQKKCGAKQCASALGIDVDNAQLHDALYDAKITAMMLAKLVKEE